MVALLVLRFIYLGFFFDLKTVNTLFYSFKGKLTDLKKKKTGKNVNLHTPQKKKESIGT